MKRFNLLPVAPVVWHQEIPRVGQSTVYFDFHVYHQVLSNKYKNQTKTYNVYGNNELFI